MNNTIQQMQSNLKFEKLLDLFQEIAPNNQNVQKQISILSNSKDNYIKQLQGKWNAIKPPTFTELEIREICQSYYDGLEHTNEMRLLQGLPKVAIVDSRNWIVKSENSWHGWNCEQARYYTEPLLFEGSVNYHKLFEPLTISNKDSGSINIIWTLDKFILQGSQMGLSESNWINVWLTLAKQHLPNDFQSLSRHSDNADALFGQMSASLNSENEIAKIRSALGQITRKPTEMLQSPLFKMRSFYEMLLSIEYPAMSKDDISLRADYYSASSGHHLVGKNTAIVIAQFISIRNTEGEPISVTAITNLVTSHEASNPGDRPSTVLYLPESCTRLDKQAYQASNVTDLVLATSKLTLGRKERGHSSKYRPESKSGDRSSRSFSRDRKYPDNWQKNGYRQGRSKDSRTSRKDGFNRQESGDRKYRLRSGDRGNFKRSSSGNRDRQKSWDRKRQGQEKYKKSPSRSFSRDRGRSPYSKRASPARGARAKQDSNCMRCGGMHLSMDCRLYPFYKGNPCEKCSLMHETKLHHARSNSRDRTRNHSREGRPKNTYHIPDFKYRDEGDTVYTTALKPRGTRENEQDNIFRATKNN